MTKHLAETDESIAGGVLLALFGAAAGCVAFYALGEIRQLRHELGVLRLALERISPRGAAPAQAPGAASPN